MEIQKQILLGFIPKKVVNISLKIVRKKHCTKNNVKLKYDVIFEVKD